MIMVYIYQCNAACALSIYLMMLLCIVSCDDAGALYIFHVMLCKHVAF